jgi:hypothetical protein
MQGNWCHKKNPLRWDRLGWTFPETPIWKGSYMHIHLFPPNMHIIYSQLGNYPLNNFYSISNLSTMTPIYTT